MTEASGLWVPGSGWVVVQPPGEWWEGRMVIYNVGVKRQYNVLPPKQRYEVVCTHSPGTPTDLPTNYTTELLFPLYAFLLRSYSTAPGFLYIC